MSTFLLIFLFALQAHLSFGYVQLPVLTAAGEIWDIYAANDIRDILGFAELWLVDPYIYYPSLKVHLCSAGYFLGGPGISSSVGYFQRTYTDLPAHSLAYYSMSVQMINTWDPTDSFSIIIDSITQSTWTTANYPASDCSSLGLVQSVGGKIIHSAATLTLKIAFNIHSNNPSPATLIFKDVYFSFRPASTETALTADWLTNGCPASSPACSCAANCQVCFGTGATECARCVWGTSDYGSGCGGCTPSCLICSGSEANQCTVCDSSSVLALDGTCQPFCPLDSVLMSNGRTSVCVSPCPAGQFMMWNWTCGASCDAPLAQAASTPTPYCNYPCDQEIGQYVYWDGTCSSTCPYTARNGSWYFFCDACPQGYYSYQNTSCFKSCQKYFTKTTVGGSKFCTYPCASSQYLFPNGSCLSTCELHWNVRIEGTFRFCDFPCQAGYWLTNSGTCETTPSLSNGVKNVLSGVQKASAIITQTASLITSGKAITVSAAFAGRIFFNIKYLNISYSDELEDALETWSQSFISDDLTPNLPQSTINKIPARPVPYMFAKYDVPSSFLINYWQSLGMIILVLLVVIFMISLEFLVRFLKKSETYYGKIITRGKIMTQNFMIATLYGVYGDLVLYAILEYRSIKFGPNLSSLSFAFSVILLTIMLAGFVIHILLLRKYQNTKKSIGFGPLENFTKEYPGLQALYRDFADVSLDRQAFLLTMTIRDIIFSLIICTLFDYPFLQTTLFSMNSFFTTIYIIDRKPFREKFDQIQQIFFEIIGLAVNVSVLLNSIQDDHHKNTTKMIINIGKFVIGMNLVYNFSVVGLMFWQIFMITREQWQAYKLKRKSKALTIKRRAILNEDASDLNLRNSEQTIRFENESIQDQSDVIVTQPLNIEEGNISQKNRNRPVIVKSRRVR